MILEAALEYAEKHCAYIIPIHGCDRLGNCICRSGCTGNQIGKKPHIKEWQNTASIIEETIRKWWRHWPQANIGYPTGIKNNIIVIDIDPRSGGDESYQILQKKHIIPETHVALTGGGGRHLYFRHPGGYIRSRAHALGRGIDIKGDGGYVLLPPSTHRSGECYEWANDSPVTDLPDSLIEELKSSPTTHYDKLPERIIDGEQHDTLLAYAGRLRQAGLLREEIEKKLLEANQRCEYPYNGQEITVLVDSIMQYRVTDYTLDGFGNAHRFKNDHILDLKYCKDKHQWYQWNAKYWGEIYEQAELKYLAIKTIERMRQMAPLGGDIEDKVRAWAKKCRTDMAVKEIMSLAAAEPEFHTKATDYDSAPNLLNCGNGTIDFKSGIREFMREDYITKCTEINYRKDARCDRVEQFLEEVCEGRKDQIDYLQLAVGYSLTGYTDEEKVFFIVGPGGTGKTTFVEAIRAVMGGYCVTSRPQEFLASTRDHTSAASPGIAKLQGTRLVISSEMPHGAKLSEWVVKTLTGGDVITARHLYKEEFDFLPRFKLWLTMNDAPRFSYGDTGIKRRIIVIPFNYIPTKVDLKLKRTFRFDKDKQEAWLAWAVRGAMRWVGGERLAEPSCIANATRDYQEAQDLLTTFIKEICEVGAGLKVGSQELRDSLNLWATANNIKLAEIGVVSPQAFIRRMEGLGYTVYKTLLHGKKTGCFKGLRFRL